jgi:hypothetical protein
MLAAMAIASAAPPARSNPLKSLPPLQKVHHAWPIPPAYLADASPAYMDGLVHDYIRITGTCPFGILHGVNDTVVKTCAAICAAVAPARAAAKLPPPTLSVNYSPWWIKRFPPADPTIVGPPEATEMDFYTSQLEHLRELTESLGVSVGAILLDSERFHIGATHGAKTNATWLAALDRKHDLIYNATVGAFPRARIEMYDRGAMTKWDTQSAFVQNDAYTLRERGAAYSVALYSLPEIWAMRQRFNATVVNARAHNSTGALSGGVQPWLALGAGYRRAANASHPLVFDFSWDFDRVYSWQLGRECNVPWYGEHPENFAPWGAAQVNLLFPSPFLEPCSARPPPCSAAAGPGNTSTVAMQHFATYVMGAAGMDGVAP